MAGCSAGRLDERNLELAPAFEVNIVLGDAALEVLIAALSVGRMLHR